MSIILRVGGTEHAVEKLLSRLPAQRIEASWKAGEKRGFRICERPGFNLRMSDVDDVGSAMEETFRGLIRISPYLHEVAGEVDAEIDVALFVYAGRMASVLLSPAFLLAASDAGLEVRVSAYPCSDDDDDDDDDAK